MVTVTMPIMLRRLALLTAMLAMLFPARASAVAIRSPEVTHIPGSCQVTFDVLLSTEPERARALLGDHRQWPAWLAIWRKPSYWRSFQTAGNVSVCASALRFVFL